MRTLVDVYLPESVGDTILICCDVVDVFLALQGKVPVLKKCYGKLRYREITVRDYVSLVKSSFETVYLYILTEEGEKGSISEKTFKLYASL